MLLSRYTANDFSKKSKLMFFEQKILIEDVVTVEYLKFQWVKGTEIYNFHFYIYIDTQKKSIQIELSTPLFKRKEYDKEMLFIANHIRTHYSQFSEFSFQENVELDKIRKRRNSA